MADHDDCKIGLDFITPEMLANMKRSATLENLDATVAEIKVANHQKAVSAIKDAEADARTIPILEAMLAKGINPQRAVMALLVRELRDAANSTSMVGLADGYTTRTNMLLAEAAEAFKPTATGGIRNTDLINDVVRVMHGAEPKLPESARLAKAMREAADLQLRLHTDMGGTVRRLDNWFPTKHVAKALTGGGRSTKGTVSMDVARDLWTDSVYEKLDFAKMRTQAGRQMDEPQLREMLEYIWRTITTDGRSKIKMPSFIEAEHRSPFANRHSMSRMLHFKSADDWMKYNKEYGDQDHWGVFNNSLRGMALDTGAMRVFGANATTNFKKLSNWAEQMDNSVTGTELGAVWDNAMGFDLNGENRLQNIGQTTRNLLSSAWMGSAALASIPDVSTMALNAHMNAMNIPRMLAHMNSFADPASRRHMAQIAGHIEYSNSSMATNLRFEENTGAGLSKRLSDANYRLGGMHALQDRLRHTWMQEMMSKMGDSVNKSLDQLDPGFRGFLKTYGLEAEWGKIRKAGIDTSGEFPMIRLDTLKDDHLIAQVLGAIHTERDLAILTPDARVRAMLNQGKKPGTVGGEVFRSGTQFASFTATQLMHGVYRHFMTERINSKATRAAYLATSAMAMTSMGAIAYQLRELSKGREPRDMEDPQFWAMAFAYGGAAPMLMELLMSGQTRHGQTGLEVFLGPTGSVVKGGLSMTAGSLGAALQGKDWQEHMGKAAEKLSTLTPFQSLWWARAAYQRVLRDNLLSSIDPSYAARQDQKAGYIESKTGQEEYWSYGDGPLGDLQTPF